VSPILKGVLTAALLVVLAVSVYVLAAGWLYFSAGGGLDGPCFAGSTPGSGVEGSSTRMEGTAFPLGYSCITRGRSGDVVAFENRGAKGASFLALGLLVAAAVSASAGVVGGIRDRRLPEA